jgi:hypothetical protein
MPEILIQVIRFELYGFIGALAAVIVYRLLSGSIQVDGLLTHRPEMQASTDGVYVNNLQLLMVTIAGAGYYLMEAMRMAPENRLPDVPPLLLLVVAASQMAYSGAPLADLIFRKKGRLS